MNKKFNAVKGAIINDEEAQKYGERIEMLVEEHGTVSQDDVLQDAKSPKSPLHDFFEWDDTAAARKFRLRQAGFLLRAINVTVKKNGDEENLRAFHVVTIKDDDTNESSRGYTTAIKVLSDVELRKQIIEQALRQLDSWRARYKQYTELSTIFAAIDTAKEKYS